MALAVTLVKIAEFLLDSQVLLYPDSGAFLMNALGIYLVDFRSYVYGYLIRILAVPFHSLTMVVAIQMAMGGFTAWLLGAMLMRFFGVGKWIALIAALLFALDPVQVVHEHMVMAETATLTVLAVYLMAALFYLERPARSLIGNSWLAVLALLGILLVSLRIAYLPPVLFAAAAIPLAGWLSSPGSPRRALALGLLISCGSTAILHLEYRRVTGHLNHKPPRYSSMNGFFLMAGAAPLLSPGDTTDPRVSEAVAEQRRSSFPLTAQPRWAQLWEPDGLRVRLLKAFDGDDTRAEDAAFQLARTAIRRNPAGYLGLAVQNYLDFWRNLPRLPNLLAEEDGVLTPGSIAESEASIIKKWFGVDVSSRRHESMTPSRRYHIEGRFWIVFLLLSPAVTIAAWAAGPVNRPGLALLSISACLIFACVCFGAVEASYRFLHPYSWFGLAALAVLAQRAFAGTPSAPVLPSR